VGHGQSGGAHESLVSVWLLSDYKSVRLHLRSTRAESIFDPRLARCGLIISPPALKTLSTGAEEAGTDSTLIANACK